MRADILHVESIYMSFYWRAFYKPGKWAVMYMCVSDTDYASISHF
jgi:hypothetical protein